MIAVRESKNVSIPRSGEDSNIERTNEPATQATVEPGRSPSAATGLGLAVVRASEIEPRPVRWLIKDMIVAGAINMLCGMPDCGKSVLTCDLAARKTTGAPWPVGSDPSNEAGDVAFIAIEDDPATTIVPRLREAGADLKRVHIVTGVRRVETEGDRGPEPFDISKNVAELEALREENPTLSVVVIDPLDSFIGQVDTKAGNEVRMALAPLKEWAQSSGVTVLIVHHLNKSESRSAMDKVSGSRSFAALPRSVWLVTREERDNREGRTVLIPVKLNVSQSPRSVGYCLRPSEKAPEVPVVAWSDAPVELTAEQALTGELSATDRAAAWLREELATGPIAVKELKKMAEAEGHSWRTVEKAKDRASVIPEQCYNYESSRIDGWQWRLEDGASAPAT